MQKMKCTCIKYIGWLGLVNYHHGHIACLICFLDLAGFGIIALVFGIVLVLFY